MANEWSKRRNVLIVAGIVAGTFFIVHALISGLSGRFNVWYSLIGAFVFFALYFVVQLLRNIVVKGKQ